MEDSGMRQVVTTGVLLGIAGAAFLEVAKTTLGLVLIGRTELDAEAYGVVTYAVIFVVALMLAALAVRESATGFLLYALPVGLLAIALTALLLLLGTFMGWFGPYDARDARPLWRAIAMFGATLLLLVAVDLARRQYTGLLRRIIQRLRPLVTWMSTRSTWVLGGIGALLVILGLVFGR
jgi:hypothetical protein